MPRFFLPRHGRTHCPGGSDPIPCLDPTVRPWFRQSLTFNGGLSPLLLPEGAESTLQFDAEDFGDGGDTYFESRTGPDRMGVLVNGWIEMRAEVLIEDTFDSWVEIQMNDGGSFPLKQTFWNNTPQSLPTLAFNWTQRMVGTSVEFKIAHGDPLDQAVYAAYVEFAYLGPYTGTNPHDSNPDF